MVEYWETISKTNKFDFTAKRQKRVYEYQHELLKGAKYDGEWRSGFRDGYGVQVWPDNARYEGSVIVPSPWIII